MVFIALCHLIGEMKGGSSLAVGVKKEKSEPFEDDEELSAAIMEEWLNFNHTAGTSFHQVPPVGDHPVRIL